MTQPANKKPRPTKGQELTEYMVREGRLSWRQAFILLNVESELLACPDGQFAEALVKLIQD